MQKEPLIFSHFRIGSVLLWTQKSTKESMTELVSRFSKTSWDYHFIFFRNFAAITFDLQKYGIMRKWKSWKRENHSQA